MLELYQKIKSLREQQNMSQDELAKRTGYTSRTSIAKIEAGKIDLPQSKIALFADALNTTVAYLMGWEDEAGQPKTSPALTKKDERDISRQLEATLAALESQQSGLMFDGEPLDDETKELLAASLRNSMELSKMWAKKKFTPKKYRKED